MPHENNGEKAGFIVPSHFSASCLPLLFCSLLTRLPLLVLHSSCCVLEGDLSHALLEFGMRVRMDRELGMLRGIDENVWMWMLVCVSVSVCPYNNNRHFVESGGKCVRN